MGVLRVKIVRPVTRGDGGRRLLYSSKLGAVHNANNANRIQQSAAPTQAKGRLSGPLSVVPILAAITTNTISKMIFAVSAGGRAFALYVIPGLVLLVVAAWVGAVVAGPIRF